MLTRLASMSSLGAILVLMAAPCMAYATSVDVPAPCSGAIQARWATWRLSPPEAGFADYAKRLGIAHNIAKADFDGDGIGDVAVSFSRLPRVERNAIWPYVSRGVPRSISTSFVALTVVTALRSHQRVQRCWTSSGTRTSHTGQMGSTRCASRKREQLTCSRRADSGASWIATDGPAPRRWTKTGRRTQGRGEVGADKRRSASFARSLIDGSECTIKGTGPNAREVTVRGRWEGGRLVVEQRTDTTSITTTVSVSPDGNELTVETAAKGPQGDHREKQTFKIS